MTPRQFKLLEAYKLSGSVQKSAEIAGYHPTSATKLLKSAKFVQEIAKWQQETRDSLKDRDSFVQFAMSDYHKTPIVHANRPRFLELAGKGAGIIGDSQSSTTNNTVNILSIKSEAADSAKLSENLRALVEGMQ